MTFPGDKKTCFKKGPNNGLVSEKNTSLFHGRGGGSDESVKNFMDFFLMKASLMYISILEGCFFSTKVTVMNINYMTWQVV